MGYSSSMYDVTSGHLLYHEHKVSVVTLFVNDSDMYNPTHIGICWWKVVLGVVAHHQGLVVTDKRVPVMSKVELLVCCTCNIKSS